MKKLTNWLVALDNTAMDHHIIRYVKYLAEFSNPDNIFFVNVQKEELQYDYLPAEMADVVKIVADDKKLALKGRVEQHFTSLQKCSFHILTGEIGTEIILFCHNHDVDLVFLGIKPISEGMGLSTEKLIKKSPCSCFLIPMAKATMIKKIMVPIDFSPHSRLAFEQAVAIKKNYPQVQLITYHLYSIPEGYKKSGISYMEFGRVMQKHAQATMQEIAQTHKVNLMDYYDYQESSKVAESILHKAKTEQADLIIMGSRGHNAAALMLLGSTSVKLSKINDQIPVAIVKKEGENQALINMLQN
ncbi:MAG: universal stress protein [Candidatus Cyclobacteriaceae bacterium M3_2C_046]